VTAVRSVLDTAIIQPIAEAAGPWTLGWEFILALVTLLLALFTGWLAWTTRRLARTTVQEVQGQTRPVVVPVRDTVQASGEQGDQPFNYFNVTIRLRNIGAGPALNFDLTIGEGSASEPLPALGAGSEHDAVIRVPGHQENEGAHPYNSRTSRLVIEYFDLAVRRYTTEVWLGFLNTEGPTQIQRRLSLSSGSVPRQAPSTGPALVENPLMAAQRGPGIRMLPFAWRQFVLQDPDALPRPLWPRLREAWRWMYPKHSRTRMQRLMWAHRAYKATLNKQVRPWVPRFLDRPYVITRGLKWGYLAYRNMRF
jgi:hypothetical protein